MTWKSRTILVIVAVVSVFSWAQVRPKPVATSTSGLVADGGSPTFTTVGASSLAVTGQISVDGGIIDPVNTLTLKGNATDGASAVGVSINNGVAFTTNGAKYLSLQDNGTEFAHFNRRASYFALGFGTQSSEGIALGVDSATKGIGFMEMRGATPEITMLGSTSYITMRGAGGVRNDDNQPVIIRGGNESGNVTSVKIYPYAGTTTSATKLVQVYKDQGTTQVFNIGGLGDLHLSSSTDATDDACTVNKPSGRCQIGAGNTTLTVTNSLVAATSKIMATISTDDATAILKNCVPGSGSFVCKTTAAVTADTTIDWVVFGSF